MKNALFISTLLIAPLAALAAPAPRVSQEDFRAKLLSALNRHLNLLAGGGDSGIPVKGKTAGGDAALAFCLVFETTGEQRFRKAALALAGQVLKDMRATRFGVLPIKEKEKPGGEKITGGGPPALGAYASTVAYILHREGGRADDLRYIATVLDRYPWNPEGWWAATIDVVTGEPKLPMDKPSIINKSAAIAMAAGIVASYVAPIDPGLAARLKQKADKCIYSQIIPAQEADGFWHYNISGRDPKDKDVLGYFMLTTKELMTLQHFNPAYREARLNAALARAQAFALRCIAPMTEPNAGPACTAHPTPATPSRYSLERDAKRSFQLGLILIAGGHLHEGVGIMNAALAVFPYGNRGQDGAHAAEPSALILSALARR